ncbi:pilus assembly protein PilC [bacterium E08(2017)]|nr:pilus assembly protein PilC [bacterium E08(2017)]
MPRFKYVAMDSQGSESSGVIDAEDQQQALAAIRAHGLFPTKISDISSGGGAAHGQAQAGAAAAPSSGLNMEIKLPTFLQPKVKPKQLMVFTRQLATLVDAGLPLLRGLRILLKQEKHPRLIDAINGMSESVEGGSTFSDALNLFPNIFDRLFINMVKAGEAGGVLEVVLRRLAEFMEKTEKIKAKVKGAMIYPVVVLVFAGGILAFLLIKVIPQFEKIFNELLGGQLPALTRFVISISNTVVDSWYWVVAVIVLLVVLMKIIGRTKKGRYIMDAIAIKMPVFGPLFQRTAIARFTRTLGTLMSSGVPVLQALTIVRDTAGNDVVAQAIQNIHDSVKEGDPMAMQMEANSVFPGMVVSMVDVGEETGALPDMLMRIADGYDDEVDSAVEGLTSVIEPIMIILLAVIIGTIVIAMFMPLISLISNIQ